MNANVYEKLYMNMKNNFTVVSENLEYTLGEYMLMKAGKKKTQSSILPVAKTSHTQNTAVSTFFRYINEKLTVKTPPVKDKTIRRFPLRTAAAACLSGVIACSLIFSYGSANMLNSEKSAQVMAEVEADDCDRLEYTTID